MTALSAPIPPNSIHLCLDMQRLLQPEGPWPLAWAESALARIVSLVEGHAEQTIFTRFVPPNSPAAMPGRWKHYYERWRQVTREFLDPSALELLEPLPSFAPPARILDKRYYSAFTGTDLHQILKHAGTDTLILSGAETDVCVLSTICSGVDLGYRMVVANDAATGDIMSNTAFTPVACSRCFSDHGLHLNAERTGIELESRCPNCGAIDGKKLGMDELNEVAHRFFVWGSLQRFEYGAAPSVVYNTSRKTDIDVSSWLSAHVALFERILGIGLFHYGPRAWMFGEIEPLKDLQNPATQKRIIDRIVSEYPEREIDSGLPFYRVRKSSDPLRKPSEFDSPPVGHAGKGRLDSPGEPILYASPDLEICVHECRFSAEDELYVATLHATSTLRLLDLSALLKEEHVTEFESLDMTVHMLFLAGSHSYDISRAIAVSARQRGFQGIIYPSYFSLLRQGMMPFPTVYGISHRRVPQFQDHEAASAILNLALFGRPILEGRVSVKCLNKLIMRRVGYDFHFGPVEF
jgi:nicotinamidase-related amidase